MLRDYFLPHPQTHQKAHLLSWHGLVIYLFLFLFIQVGLNVYGAIRPGVLGINSSITQAQVIDLTNQQRAKNGLGPVVENSQLDAAAVAKAKNMFEENYWAHYSPSGKSPWDFISRAGYKYIYAGENLARNFYSSEDVVSAWMSSPTHRANILNPKYQEIGIAVAEGMLNGTQTVLVVQEFGAQNVVVAEARNPSPLPTLQPAVSSQQLAQLPIQGTSLGTTISEKSSVLIDPYQVTRNVGVGILMFMAGLLLIDLYVMHRRAVYRLSSRHISHLSIISIGITMLWLMHPGSIL